MEPEEARRALREVGGRREQVASELGRMYPSVWTLAVFVLGYSVIFAGTDFGFPVPLVCFGVGAVLMAAGLLAAYRHESRYGVKGPRDMWDARTASIAIVWLAAMWATFTACRAVLAAYVPEGVTSVLAAIPLAVLTSFMLRWLFRRACGADAVRR